MSDYTNNYNYAYKTNTKVPYTLVGLIIFINIIYKDDLNYIPLTKNNIPVNA